MSVVTGALGSLAPKLLQLLHGEYKLQKGVKKQVQWLHSELESIYAFLGDVSEVPWDRLNRQVKVWVREVREASYDMEDVLDTYLVHVDGGEPIDPSRLKRAMKKMGKVFTKAKARRSIAGAIEDMKKGLQEIAERRQRYKLDEIMSKHDTTKSTIDPRLSAMYKEVTQLIGMDKSMEDVISLLNPSHRENDVFSKNMMKKVSIVGVGGLGKTTLAKALYDKLSSEYESRAFVSVGRDRDLVTVLKDILFHLDKDKCQNIHNAGRGVDLVIQELGELLKNKRYFIFIDDVWEVSTWEAIELALVENNLGSKVITTTRNFDVAKASGGVYKLKPLSSHDSMKLFYTRLSSAEQKFHGISEKIIKKCSGIPLAIITMSSLLASKPEYEWPMICDSIGFDTQGNKKAEDTMTILSFSYYALPPHLRTCLLYLSTYPEDHAIERDSLIWKWIAEGFVHEKQGATLFELGEKYFSDLINRSLIQALESWDHHTISGCRIHDMVLDMIRTLALEENFLAILGDNLIVTCPPSNIRRLAHQNGRAEHNNPEATVTEMTKVRSYSTFMCTNHNLDQFLRFKILRVLDIVDCRFVKGCHLHHLGDLLHLRYLGIRKCEGIGPVLPKHIGNLKLLQTIDVDVVLPESFVQLKQLLRLRAGLKNAQDGIENLTSLQELIMPPIIRNGAIPMRLWKQLGRLVKLRVLAIGFQRMQPGWDESCQRDFVESLCHLKKIKHLTVSAFFAYADTAVWEEARFVFPECLCYLSLPFKFSRMPSCIDLSRLPYLSRITLWVIHIDEHDLRLLAKLPELCYLELGTGSTVTLSNINGGDGGFFQKLRYLSMWSPTVVQFEQPNEKEASVSFHMWNGKDAMPFVPRKSSDFSKAVVPRGVMPNLEIIKFKIPFQAIKDNNGDSAGSFGVEFLPSLRKLGGWIDCRGVCAEEVDAVLAALGNACKVHPNHPTFEMNKFNEDKMVSTHNKEDAEQREVEEMASHTADINLDKLCPESS